MGKAFYVGQCPICCGYGRLEIDKDILKDKLVVICEECLTEWETPQQALKNIKGQRGSVKGKVRNATFDEIKTQGWDRFVLDISVRREVNGM